MPNLLERLTEQAASLLEGDLPSSATIRPVLGALIKEVESLQTHVLGDAAPAVEQVEADAVKTVEEAAQPEDSPAAPAAAAASSASETITVTPEQKAALLALLQGS